MKPSNLIPGDILLYKNHGWLGAVISWGSWTGTPKEALEYSHIGLVLDDLQSVEMNPPNSRKFSLDEVPWDRVDIWRVNIEGVNPFQIEIVRKHFVGYAMSRLGEKYNYGYIATSAGLGLLSRIGLGSVSRWLINRSNPMPGNKMDVCSTWAEEVISEPIRLLKIDFDLFPDLGENRARPSDWPRSPYLVKVF